MEPPSEPELAETARRYGFSLDKAGRSAFRELAAENLTSHRRVRDLYARICPTPPNRTSEFPEDAHNELGAWYVRTRIPPVDRGAVRETRRAQGTRTW